MLTFGVGGEPLRGREHRAVGNRRVGEGLGVDAEPLEVGADRPLACSSSTPDFWSVPAAMLPGIARQW